MADDQEEPQSRPSTRTGAEQASALDKVTDMVEEKEIQAAAVDQSRIQQAMARLAQAEQGRVEAQRAQEKELAGVKVQKEHIEQLAEQYELDKKAAERRLRECKGDLRAALASYLQV